MQGQNATRYSLPLQRDATVAADAVPSQTQLVGEVPGVTLIVVDTYASLPGGMSYCQAGEERFLRIFALGNAAPEETLRIKLASCRQNIELADPGVEWQAATSTLVIHWLSGPSTRTKPEQLTLRVGAS